MSWYTKNEGLSYEKPIFAVKGNVVMMLIPNIGDNYDIIGYNWFNLKTGDYNSCCSFKTPQEAVYYYDSQYVTKNLDFGQVHRYLSGD